MMSFLRSHWPHLAAGMICLATAGCSSTQTPIQNDPPEDTGTTGGQATNEPNPEAPQPTSENTPSGPKAPDFTLKTLSGGQITLSELKGKVVLVDFWSTTCDPCLAEMPELVKLYEERKEKGFEILAVTIDGPETAAKVPATVKKNKMIFPILLDEDTEAMDRFNPKGELPFTAVIDKNGFIVLKRAGYQPGDKASWKALVDAVDGALAAN
jgi:peroxiredoxin